MKGAIKNQDDDGDSGSDMQMESDVDMEEEQVDVEGDEEDQEVDDVDEEDDDGGDGDGEAEAEVEEEESQSAEEEDEARPPLRISTQPRLKITLKLPANHASSNSAGTATPDDAEMDYAAFKRTPKRRAKAKVIQDIDVESEDPTSPSDSDDDESAQDTPSTGIPATGAKPMTTRQAVLASVVDPTHVSLNEGSRSKKQPLNETELALRREETARKRKNLSEKKLEDEKAETINRLLKKQSRPKNKRTNTIDDRSPMPTASGSRTPRLKAKANDDGEDGEVDEDEDDAMDAEQSEEVKPIMYRWVSSLREFPGEGERKKVEIGITFSVPEVLLPPPPVNERNMVPDAELEKARAARGPGVCAIAGCGMPRKYRLPKDWTIGACDSVHLRLLASQV